MTRSISTELGAQIDAKRASFAVFVEMDFSGGFLRLWSGYGDVEWDGKTWNGAGEFLGMSSIRESQEIRANGVTLTLTGLDSSKVSAAYGQYWQGRPINIWLAPLTVSSPSNVQLDGEPLKIFNGKMDALGDSDDGENITFSLTAESELIDLSRSREVRLTDEVQKSYFPSDRGLEFVSTITDKQIDIKYKT